jgi:hypothetical protein
LKRCTDDRGRVFRREARRSTRIFSRVSRSTGPTRSGRATSPIVRLDVVGPRRVGDSTLEHVWNASSYEDALLLLREEVSRSGGDLPDTGKVTKSAGNGA